MSSKPQKKLPLPVEIDASSPEPVITMRRIFDAPRELVWTALTDPRHVAQWYGGFGFENPLCEMHVRPGGRWRHLMRTPDGSEHLMEFVFVEVLEPERLSWKSADRGSFSKGAHRNLMTVTLEDLGEQTRWTLVTRFESLEAREEARLIGFAQVLSEGTEKFNDLVKSLRGA